MKLKNLYKHLVLAVLYTLLIFTPSCGIDLTGWSPSYPYSSYAIVKVNLPEECSGKNIHIWLLKDFNITEDGIYANIVSRFTGICSVDTILIQNLGADSKDTYYLCALVSTEKYTYHNKFPLFVPKSGDYFGYYGSGFLPPDKPNFKVMWLEEQDLYLKKVL